MSDNASANLFVHLRLHTEYSISDSIVTIKPLLARAIELGMPTIAVTDLGNLFGLIKFYTGAISQGIKPLCGCDVLVMDEQQLATHLVLLVKNTTGYLNLTRLISRAYTEKTTHNELHVKKAWLNEYSEGLIALSGARRSDVGKAILDGDTALASELAREWLRLFPQSYYLELQRTGREGDEKYLQGALSLAQALNCPVVATNDVRFLGKEDFEAHEVRVCITERRSLNDPRRTHNYSEQQYLRSSAEMQELFTDIPEAIENSVEIAKRCNLELELNKPCLPTYPVPDDVSTEEFFRQVSEQGLQRRLAQILDPQSEDFKELSASYYERLETELEIIIQMGFPGYFLIVMEFIQWARENDIPVGPGRGSGAGSIVAYSLGITDVDPLKYDLLFERFLNPERVSMPDFDVDFCMEGRDRVIQHVTELYGKEAVSQIITFGTMAAKAVIRDVARAQDKSYALADKLSKLVPFEPGMTLSKALEQEPQMKKFIDSDEDAQEIMEMAFKLEGIIRNVGKHAGGVVIAPTRLTDFSPLYCDENGEGLVTQFDKNDVETVGLVKFDFLGLRTLTIIDWAIKMINASQIQEQSLNINEISLDDTAVYSCLQNGETTAIFQLESRGMKDLIKRLRPSSFEDIVALVALFRPGPLQSGMVDDFIDRKHGRAEVSYPHPDLEPVLKNTYGVILYQEQVMQIAQVLASYTLGEADMLRRAMGKKKPEEMEYQRGRFIEGAIKREVSYELAGSIFDLMEKFAGYGFNRSHSVAYALISYQTAWLKTHYPAYFMAAVLSADMQNTDKVVALIDECQSMKLPLLHPDVNVGNFNFTVNSQGEIVYGLGAIKGLGEGPVNAIIQARKDSGPFTDLLNFCTRVDSRSVNKRIFEALIKSGALDELQQGDGIDYIRAILMSCLEDNIRAAQQSTHNQDSGVEDLFGNIESLSENVSDLLSAKGITVRPWNEQQRLTAEKDTLGLYLTGHPIDEFLPEIRQIARDRIVNLKPERGPQLVAGLVYSVRTMKSKRGDTLAFLVLDDKSGRFEVSLFAKEYEKYRDILHRDEILVIDCLVSVDDYSGGMRGRAKEIMTLQEARQKLAKRMTITLNVATLENNFCTELASILAPYRLEDSKPEESEVVATIAVAGSAIEIGITSAAQSSSAADKLNGSENSGCPVAVQFQRHDSEGCIILGRQWQVSLTNDLLQRLKSEFGKSQVTVLY
ncbi:MAG: DNA polymerase III subunit alpha [Gammaproteobacteria bacterium]|nr:DNA polymerase III subunit alpha [Gammaproteobacteria bacterium]